MLLLFASMLLLSSAGYSQINPINKTPEQLATEMTASISNTVSLTTEQQTQMQQAAVQYFASMRARDSIEMQRTLYENFMQTLQSIMTTEVYEQWKDIVISRKQQMVKTSQSNNR